MEPWRTVGVHNRRSRASADALPTRLAAAPDGVLAALRAENLRAATTEGLAGRLEAVDALLDRVPDLATSVRRVARVVHPLAARPGYDVSHSQPVWPDRIFVSFPEREDEVGEVRLAESVVHEAMHLLLTEEEEVRPLVDEASVELWSPWMGTPRSAAGVLHGLFVFHCIRSFIRQLSDLSAVGEEALRHSRVRLREIDAEIAEVNLPALLATLTPWGRSRVRLWSNGS